MAQETLITLEIIDMIRQLDLKSTVLYLHSFHTGALMQDIAKNLGVVSRAKNQQWFWLCGLTHDIGKLDIPSHILLKPGRLTEDEMAIMQKHSEYSRDRLLAIEPLAKFADIAYSHHEKGAGNGYPRGLKSYQMSLEAKMLSVCDRFQAMASSGREYRPAAMPLAHIFHLLSPDIRGFFGDKYGIVMDTLLTYHRDHSIQKGCWTEDRLINDLYHDLPREVAPTEKKPAEFWDLKKRDEQLRIAAAVRQRQFPHLTAPHDQ